MRRYLKKQKNYRLVWGLAAAVVLMGSANAAKASAAENSMQKSVQKVEKAWQEAGSTKTVKTVRVTIKTSKKKMWADTSSFTNMLSRQMYGNAYVSSKWQGMETEFINLGMHKMKKKEKSYRDEITGIKIKIKYSGKKLTYILRINGKDKDTKETYQDIEANKYCAAEIQNATKNMDQYDRAWYVNQWVQGHANFEEGYTPGWVVLKKRKAKGVCYDLAYFYEKAACYAGIKHYGRVSNSGHTWNVVKIDGKIYYIDIEHSRSAVRLYYSSMAGLVDYLNNDAVGTEKAAMEKNVEEGYFKKAMITVKEGYADELWQKVQTAKASMTEQEWKEKIDGYWKSEDSVFAAYEIQRETMFSEPWEVGFARFGLQTLKQATDYSCYYSFAEYDKPSKWLYAWILK